MWKAQTSSKIIVMVMATYLITGTAKSQTTPAKMMRTAKKPACCTGKTPPRFGLKASTAPVKLVNMKGKPKK